MLAPQTSSSKAKGAMSSMDGGMLTVYLGALALGALVYQSYSDLGLSTLLTLAVGIQCFGYTCLRLQIAQKKTVAGVSGYIPVDQTGDWLYQLLDISALLMVLQILYCVFKSHRHSYQEQYDVFSVQGIMISCFILAVFVHPDLNDRPLFDTLWATALYIDVVAMVPQLAMMAKIQGEVEALTSHFVGATAMSRLVSLIFWYHGFSELAPLDGSFNLAGWAIIAAHVLQVLLLCDFLFYYVRAIMTYGSACLPMTIYVDV